jgi:superfamily I DNA and/or RNA helicase
VAVGVTYRDQRSLIRAGLDAAGLGEVVVDTANRLQGREFAVTVAWHPLSGRRDASAFHLEAGRLCVLASRHRHACVVVCRAGVREQLDSYPSVEPVWLGVDPPQVDGWEANHVFLEQLAGHAVPV